MKSKGLLFLVVILLLSFSFATVSAHSTIPVQPDSPSVTGVDLDATGFHPAEVTIWAGDSVQFNNLLGSPLTLLDGPPHFIYLPFMKRPGGTGGSSLPGSLAPSSISLNGVVIPGGQSYTRVFANPGEYFFFLSENPYHTCKVTVKPLSDLSVQSVTATPNPAASGELLHLESVIANLGINGTSTFRVDWQITSLNLPAPVLSGSWDVPPLAAGANTTLSINLTAPAPGPYTITVSVDPEHALPDTDLSNNTRQIDFGVTGTVMVCANYASDTTWGYATYVLTCDTSILSGVTLTISDAAVVKPQQNTMLVVYGTLNAAGTAEKPVVFTSMADDSHGGDTNNDGTASSPAKGDWLSIHVASGGSAVIDHAILTYGGSPARYGYPWNLIRVEGGSLALTNSTVSNSYGKGIALVNPAALVVDASVIADNNETGIQYDQVASAGPQVSGTTFTNNQGYALNLNLGTLQFDGTKIQNNSATGNTYNGIGLVAVFSGTSVLSGNAGIPYILTSDSSVVAGASLAIQAGAVVKPQQNTMLVAYGTLNLAGTGGQPVVFTSLADDTRGGDTNNDGTASSPAKGDWLSTHVASGGSAVIDHAVLTYGGSPARYGYPWNIIRVEGGSLTLTNSTVSNSYGKGIALVNPAALVVDASVIADNNETGIQYDQVASAGPQVSGTTFTNNQGYALNLNLGTLQFDGTKIQNNSAAGNTYNGIGLVAAFSGTSVLSGNAGMPYIFTGDSIVGASASLAIQAGAVVKPQQNTMLVVYGTLNAAGTVGQPVVFTSLADDSRGGDTNNDGTASSPAKGDWLSIHVASGGSAVIDHAVLTYGGSPSRYGYPWNIIRVEGGSLALTNSTVSNSYARGIALVNPTGLVVGASVIADNDGTGIQYDQVASAGPQVSGTTFNNNKGYAINLSLGTLQFDGTGIQNNSAAGNTYNGIGLVGVFSGTSVLSESPGMAYILTGDSIVDTGANLAIQAGAVVKPQQNTMLLVYGALNAAGTAEKPVVFTSLSDDSRGGDTNNDGPASSPAKGDWLSIHVASGGSAVIDHAILTYGGSPSRYGYPWNIIRIEGGSLTLTNSTVSKSYGKGIALVNPAALVVDGCTIADNENIGIDFATSLPSAPQISGTSFSNNRGYAINLDLGQLQFDGTGIQNNNVSGNNYNGIGLRAAFIGSSSLSGNAGMPYIPWSDTAVNPGGSLLIQAGAIVKPQQNTFLYVYGALNLAGTAGQPVVFTSIADDNFGGDTNNDGAASSPAVGDWLAIHIISGGTAVIDHAYLSYGGSSARYGYPWNTLRNDGGALTLTNSTVTNSLGSALAQYAGSLEVRASILSKSTTGLSLYGSSGTPILDYVEFNGNDTGVYFSAGALPQFTYCSFVGNTSWGMYNVTTSVLNAANNWWGSPSGPIHPSNIGGAGDRVSDYVIFAPWLPAHP
jgi:hypothetical protein